jgi:hypothetical protein
MDLGSLGHFLCGDCLNILDAKGLGRWFSSKARSRVDEESLKASRTGTPLAVSAKGTAETRSGSSRRASRASLDPERLHDP